MLATRTSKEKEMMFDLPLVVLHQSLASRKCTSILLLVAKSYLTLWDPETAACQAPLSFAISQSLLKFMSIKSVMLSSHVILCCSLLLLLSIFPSIRVFSSELALCIRWPKYWSFSFSISPSNQYSQLISGVLPCWHECNCMVVWTLLDVAFLWNWNKNWRFLVPWSLLSFSTLQANWVQHFNSIIFEDFK